MADILDGVALTDDVAYSTGVTRYGALRARQAVALGSRATAVEALAAAEDAARDMDARYLGGEEIDRDALRAADTAARATLAAIDADLATMAQLLADQERSLRALSAAAERTVVAAVKDEYLALYGAIATAEAAVTGAVNAEAEYRARMLAAISGPWSPYAPATRLEEYVSALRAAA